VESLNCAIPESSSCLQEEQGCMRRLSLSAFALLSAAVFSACGPDISILMVDVDRLKAGQGEIRSRQADIKSELDGLNEQLQKLSGRLEEIEYQQRARVGGDLSTLRQEVSSLKKRVPPPAMVPLQVLENDEQALSSLPPEISEPLGEALSRLRLGEYDAALKALDQAQASALDEKAGAPLLFWRAVALEGLGDNKGAIAAYHELVARFGRNDHTAVGLLRLGALFLKVGDIKTARITLQKLIADFPKSAEAAVAKERLKALAK
jgi:TolA-binding protein